MPSLSAPFSTAAVNNLDWRTWWDGPKRGDPNIKDDRARERGHDLLKEEDKADTIEEESAKLKIKCEWRGNGRKSR
jgi:hypothetical protein